MHTGKKLGEAIADAIQKKINNGSIKSKADVAHHFGIKVPSIYTWIKNGTISKDKLPELWNYFADVAGPEHWGLHEFPVQNLQLEAKEECSIYEINQRTPKGYVRLEYLSPTPSMGFGSIVDEPVRIIKNFDVLEQWLRREIGITDPKRVKVLTSIGRSMLPTIKDKDLVFIDVSKNYIDSPGIYVIDVAGRLLLKKALILSDGTLILRSDNAEEFPDEEKYDIVKDEYKITVCGKYLARWTLEK